MNALNGVSGSTAPWRSCSVADTLSHLSSAQQRAAADRAQATFLAEPELLSEGTFVSDRYRVLGLLGRGGMGTVFEVEHLQLGKRFALKVLRADLRRDAALVALFVCEQQLLAALQSEHVVSVLDSGKLEDGRPYFVMERLHGEDLRSLLERAGPLPVGRAVNIALVVCQALQMVHSSGVVHRDLKPENLFIARGDDGRDVVKLLDFGVAKRGPQRDAFPGTLVGTVRYMAPEQICNGAVGPQADIFAIGVILYECLAGKRPFQADTLERTLFAIMNQEPPTLEQVRAGLPPALSRTVQRALAKRPEDRYESVVTLGEELARCLSPLAVSSPRAPVRAVSRALAAFWARATEAVALVARP